MTEIALPRVGSTTFYTLVQTRPGPAGLERPAPPPPSDADKVRGTHNGEIGLVQPRAFSQGLLQQFSICSSSDSYVKSNFKSTFGKKKSFFHIRPWKAEMTGFTCFWLKTRSISSFRENCH